jgi:hypothetical protein
VDRIGRHAACAFGALTAARTKCSTSSTRSGVTSIPRCDEATILGQDTVVHEIGDHYPDEPVPATEIVSV